MKHTIFSFVLALTVVFTAGLSPVHAEEAVEPRLEYAARVIKATYGDRVSYTQKNKQLLKFGRNAVVGTTTATVMTLPSGEVNETFVTTNVIDKYSSSSTSDATETIVVEGHTCTGGVPTTFVTQTVTMAGQTETALTTPLCRVTRVYNTAATELVGNIYIYQDDTVSSGVPQTAAKIHMTVPAGKQQSVKAATALSSTDYAVCTQAYGSVLDKTAGFVDFEIQLRTAGGVFREQFQFSAAASSTTAFYELDPPLIVTPSADIRLVATADNASTPVSGGFNCYLAEVQ